MSVPALLLQQLRGRVQQFSASASLLAVAADAVEKLPFGVSQELFSTVSGLVRPEILSQQAMAAVLQQLYDGIVIAKLFTDVHFYITRTDVKLLINGMKRLMWN